MSRIWGNEHTPGDSISPDQVIAILNQTIEPEEDKIPDDREVNVISSTPSHYHFITKHTTDSRLVYTNVYFMDKTITKPKMTKAGMVFLESTLLKLLDLYRKSSDVFKSEIEENIDPITSNKKLTVDINLKNRMGKFSIHAFFDFDNEQLDIKKVKVDNTNDEDEDPSLESPGMFIQINSEENYIVDYEEKALSFRKKIFITAKN